MRLRSGALRLMLFLGVFASFALSVPSVRSQAAPVIASADIIIQHGVAMKTRDGVTLYADIYRPKSSDRLPVILMRTRTTKA